MYSRACGLSSIIVASSIALTLMPCVAIARQDDAASFSIETLSSEQILQRSKKTLVGTIDEVFRSRVEQGEGFVIELATNPMGLGKFAGYLGNDGQVWIPYWDSDGYCVECNSFYKFDSLNSGIFGISGTPIVGFIQWKPTGAGTEFEFTVHFSRNLLKNKELLDRIPQDKRVGRMGFDAAEKVAPQLIPENQRIAAWAKLWSEVQFNFAFFDQVPELDWDAAFIEDLPKIRAAKTNAEYFRTLQRRVAMLKDAHTEVFGKGILPGGAWLPIACQIKTNNELVVVSTIAVVEIPNSDRRVEFAAANLKAGEVITHLDDQPIAEFLTTEIYPFISASTAQWRNLVSARKWDQGPYHSKAKLKIRSADGQVRDVVLTRSHYRSMQAPKPEFKMLDNDIAYVRLDSFSSDFAVRKFESHLEEVRNSKGLIIDLRTNGGGDSAIGGRIISHLIEKPIQGSVWKTRKYMPAFRAWDEREAWHVGEPEWIQPAKQPYLGPVVLLIGPATYSAAEDFAVALHQAKRATLLGKRTAGSTGQPLRIQLPGGGSARICCKRDTYPDGREFVGFGVEPDIKIATSRTNSDPIKAALEFLMNGHQ